MFTLFRLPDVQVGFTDLSLACDILPGHQVATCQGCDDDAGILPRSCNLSYSFSKADDSAAKEVASNSEKVVALCLMLLLGILVFMLLRELRRKQRIPKSIWKGRGEDGGNVEVEKIQSRIWRRLEKGQCFFSQEKLPKVFAYPNSQRNKLQFLQWCLFSGL